MYEASTYRTTIRRIAIFDENFADLGFDFGIPPAALDARMTALLQLAAAIATGTSSVCVDWATERALAGGASKNQIADVLLAIAPITGVGRIVTAAPDLARALGFDVDAALEGLDDS